MHKHNNRAFSFFRKFKNRNFKKLFLKNWLTVFLSLVIPLIVSVWFIHYNNQQALLREIDESARRSTKNVTSTFNTLFSEACDTLEREIVDQHITNFFSYQCEIPPSYSFISTVRSVIERVNADYHKSLYYSVDCYSGKSNFIVSSKYQGQYYPYVSDDSITTVYHQYKELHPNESIFATSRQTAYWGMSGEETPSVLTIYCSSPLSYFYDCFVSISIDPDKLTGYVVDAANTESSSFLLIDADNNVIFDSSDVLINSKFYIEEDTNSFTGTINDQTVRIFWTPMDMFNWKCLQIIPLTEYQHSTQRLQTLTFFIIVLASVTSIIISYAVTTKLFRPIEAILNVVENPQDYQSVHSSDDELQYILVQILELFQKNITLENEMLDRVIALRRLRANALQKQMTPHFLNNILNVINWTAIEETGNDNCVTSQQLVLLSDIIRTMKEQTGNLTTVEAEIEYTKKFVELECLRYGSQIVCTYEIDDSVLQMPIPAISLQTLVENAIAHGLQPNDAAGNIRIIIGPNELSGLHICVEDDGVGMEQSKIDQIFDTLNHEFTYTGEHLGLINLFQRFRLIYSEECIFRIEPRDSEGLRIEIDTPTVDSQFLL